VHTPVIEALYSLFKYHQATIDFDIHLRDSHPYMSQPWDWIVLSRPVSFYYAGYTNAAGTHPCPATGCPAGPSWSQEVLIIGPARASPRRRAIGAAIAGTYVLAVLILFWYFYPILAGQIIPYSSWSARMWYRGWI
jgi:dolichyl-phosphate-mannose--protein O-mannosyl transferase